LQVVANAKVPIIKFVEVQSNINFDISFDVANGPIAAGFVRDLMDTLPQTLLSTCWPLQVFA